MLAQDGKADEALLAAVPYGDPLRSCEELSDMHDLAGALTSPREPGQNPAGGIGSEQPPLGFVKHSRDHQYPIAGDCRRGRRIIGTDRGQVREVSPFDGETGRCQVAMPGLLILSLFGSIRQTTGRE